MTERKNLGIPLDCVSDGGAYLPEREKVRELRMREMGCAEIAKQLDIPEGTVILHCLKLGLPVTGSCRRLPLPEEDAAGLHYHRREPKYANCPVCGKKIIQPPTGRPKKFCSRSCRNKFWNENYDWSTDYKSVDDYPPIVFDSTIYEGISGPPGGAMLKIEGTILAEEMFPNHRSLYLITEAGEKWALSRLNLEDAHELLDRKIEAYGAYTGIAPVNIQSSNREYIPSMCVIRYVLADEIINPKITNTEFYFDLELRDKYVGKYRHEAFEGKTLSEVKELLGGLFLYHENN